MKNFSFVLFVSFMVNILAGCVTAKDFAAMIEAASRDNASGCGALVAGMGGISVTPAPVIPGAGYFGRATFCRTNQPGTVIEQGPDGSLKITQGQGEDAAIKSRIETLEEALKYLLQKMLKPAEPGIKKDNLGFSPAKAQRREGEE